MSFAGMQPEDGWVLGSSYMRLCGRPGLGLGPAKAPMRFPGAGVGRTLHRLQPSGYGPPTWAGSGLVSVQR